MTGLGKMERGKGEGKEDLPQRGKKTKGEGEPSHYLPASLCGQSLGSTQKKKRKTKTEKGA